MKRYSLLVGLFVMLWATETMAYTIGFGNLGGSNLSAFNSYTESVYTVSARPGDSWFVAKVFGNEIPAIGAGPIYNSNPGESQITVTGGTFIFGGVDLTSNSALGTTYTIVGSLNGGEAFSPLTVVINNSINTFESKLFSNLGPVDTLTITGARPQGVTSFNIDNIRVSAASGSGSGSGSCTTPGCPDPNVPEPASLLLLGAGLVGIEIWRRRRGEG